MMEITGTDQNGVQIFDIAEEQQTYIYLQRAQPIAFMKENM